MGIRFTCIMEKVAKAEQYTTGLFQPESGSVRLADCQLEPCHWDVQLLTDF